MWSAGAPIQVQAIFLPARIFPVLLEILCELTASNERLRRIGCSKEVLTVSLSLPKFFLRAKFQRANRAESHTRTHSPQTTAGEK